MNRREILKTAILAPFVGLVAERVEVKEVETDRAVWYGVARYDYPVGWCQIYTGPGPMCCYNIEYNLSWHVYTMVYCLEPIKKGQSLVWYPDGTIRGGKWTAGSPIPLKIERSYTS